MHALESGEQIPHAHFAHGERHSGVGWIGDVDIGPAHPLVAVTANELCGEYVAANLDLAALIRCGSAMSGRHLTMQLLRHEYLEVDELDVLRIVK